MTGASGLPVTCNPARSDPCPSFNVHQASSPRIPRRKPVLSGVEQKSHSVPWPILRTLARKPQMLDYMMFLHWRTFAARSESVIRWEELRQQMWQEDTHTSCPGASENLRRDAGPVPTVSGLLASSAGDAECAATGPTQTGELAARLPH